MLTRELLVQDMGYRDLGLAAPLFRTFRPSFAQPLPARSNYHPGDGRRQEDQ